MKRGRLLAGLLWLLPMTAHAQLYLGNGSLMLNAGILAQRPSGGGGASTSITFSPAAGVSLITSGPPAEYSTAQGNLSGVTIGTATVAPSGWVGTMTGTNSNGGTITATCTGTSCTVVATVNINTSAGTITLTSTP